MQESKDIRDAKARKAAEATTVRSPFCIGLACAPHTASREKDDDKTAIQDHEAQLSAIKVRCEDRRDWCHD